ncbi:LuxR C-terminal-related transcriptional regulator [Bradyrhizobium elkanii]|uniref:LuxR C-terminal-related transcriptional regulator n=1 Tax=Bradyrhizobium elkanii TaxID=29448 RepID=UPI002729B255|nr:helix-turn-helix transcriptional regulator [Bradyrhizobium elkanii]WLA80330.1 helix-turn-helix transcriptional regulator [Bradyrhizobium elkanii]
MMMVATFKDPMPIGPRLTEKQAEVRDLIALGLTAKEIGERLGISHRTVEVHREEVYRKMGVKSAVEMVRKMFSPDGESNNG